MTARSLVVALAALVLAPLASAQTVDVTFRFLPDLTGPAPETVNRAFVPGSFNDWGPNSSGRIATGAPSQATYDPVLNEYRYTTPLAVGGGPIAGGHAYKIHYHRNSTGSEYTWLTDPLGTETTGPNSDSVVRVADPMVFQIAREQSGTGEVVAVSAGVFGTEAIASVTFSVNGVAQPAPTDTGDGIYRVVLASPVAPGSRVEVTARDASGDEATAAVGTVPPTVTDAPVPDGLVDGINYDPADPTKATLVLRAPGKGYVYALGTFNDWTADDDALMFRDAADPLGTRWWIEVDGLTPGLEYPFYYWVDGLIRVADPYTTKVYYPGESGYPSGAQQHAVGVLTPGASAFPWTDQAFVPPAQEDLVIYELLVRDFVRARSFTALTDTLDYLERLGVNAIELMPVSEFDGDESWGYNPAFHLALDKAYGTPDEFRAFVDAAHARGIAVFLDVVYNHATGQSPLIRLYNDGDFGAPTADNPWANRTARHPFNVFNDLDHESALTQLWLDRANRFWIEEYHVDGYRFDLSKGFTQRQTSDVGAWSAYDQSRVDLLTRMADALWAEHPQATIILEHFGAQSEEAALVAHATDRGQEGMLVWRKMNREYNQGTMGYPTATDFPSALDGTYAPNVGLPVANAVTYMESHDEQWLMWRNLAYGNAAGGYDVTDLGTALDRQALAGAFFFTVPGPRMLWQFGELGYGGGPGECLVEGDYPGECANGEPGRVANKPIRWDYWADVAPSSNGSGVTVTPASADERADRRDLYETWSKLLALRNGNALFRDPATVFSARLGRTPDRYIRLALDTAPDGEPTRAVVFGNFGVTETTVSVPFDAADTWYDFFSGEALGLPAGTQGFAMAPGAFRILTNARVEGGGPVAEETGGESPFPPGLNQVFPNPSAGAASARVVLYEAADVRLEVVDALGRVVAVVERTLAPGRHVVPLATAGLPAGLYFVRSGGRTVPLTVVR